MPTFSPYDEHLTSQVLTAAYRVALDFVPLHVNSSGPRKFTQPQLMAILVLKELLDLDYRGVAQLLTKQSSLQTVLQLSEVPHWTTLQKAAARANGKYT